MSITTGVYQSARLRVDVIGIARDPSNVAYVVYREISDERRLCVMEVGEFERVFSLVMSNATGPQ